MITFRSVWSPLAGPSALLCLVASAMTAACSAPKREPATAAEAPVAAIPGMETVRFWGDEASPEFIRRFMLSLERERVADGLPSIADLPDADYLALSGGGANGAFGAGLLCGWSEHGDRPAFKIVTGVSTGALIAPFAFVGKDYDPVLREMYTTISTRDLSRRRGLIEGLTSDALSDDDGLRELIAKQVDERFLERVAEEWRRGRLLLLGTTNMDAQRPVMWSMGALAASGHPGSLQLFRDVMIASASIPGVFPPVMITAEAEGRAFDEMHADGGVCAQVFLYPAAFSFKDLPDEGAAARRRHVYVIRNARLGPEFKPIRRRTLAIAERAIDTLIKTQGVGDLYRIYLGCLRDGLDYHLAYIPESFAHDSTEAFDRRYMAALFHHAHELARQGYPWAKAPPGFEPPVAQRD